MLGQIVPSEVANGLAAAPIAWVAALSMAGGVYLFRLLNEERKAHLAEVAALQATLLSTVKAGAEEQRQLLTELIPLSEKLTEGLEILERLTKE